MYYGKKIIIIKYLIVKVVLIQLIRHAFYKIVNLINPLKWNSDILKCENRISVKK